MRCFIALPIADELRDVMLESWAKAEKPTSAIKFVAEDHWHVTLAFLGEVEEHNIRNLVHECSRSAECPGMVTFNVFETFPHHQPRLIVAGGSPDPVHQWRLFIDHLRRQCRPFAPQLDEKPWKAHITIARAPKETQLPPWSIPVGPWTWKPGGFILYESRLGQGGSRYRAIHEFPFTH